MEVWHWGTIAAVLFILEIIAPGYFLIFPALGAFIVGLADMAGLHTIEAQLAVFLAASALIFAVSISKYRAIIANRRQDKVNQPDRLVGALGTVEDPLANGRGKIRLGDTVWLARGPDLDKGRPVRIAAVEGTVLVVEPTE